MVATFDPLSPSSASTSSHPDTSTFHTLTRERAFRHPPTTSADIPALDQLVAPHIESFNALIEDDAGKGLLQLGAEDLGERVVFDENEGVGRPLGKKITCE
jgi:DNA-directed RNA polymerase I subunit RPA2